MGNEEDIGPESLEDMDDPLREMTSRHGSFSRGRGLKLYRIDVKDSLPQDLLDHYETIFRAKGHRVARSSSSLWINVKSWLFQAMPSFNLSPNLFQETSNIFKEASTLACRFFTLEDHCQEEFTNLKGMTLLYLLQPPYHLLKVQQKARNQVRRGLERVDVRQEEFEEGLTPLLYRVYRDNILRLQLTRYESRIKRWWLKWSGVLRKASNAELWCAWRSRELVAFLILAWSPYGAEILLQRSLTQALRFYPNNALVYTVAQRTFERGAPLLSYGLSILTNPKGGLHHFKVNMGFQALPLKLNYRWHPALEPFLSRVPPEKLHGLSSSIKKALRIRQ